MLSKITVLTLESVKAMQQTIGNIKDKRVLLFLGIAISIMVAHLSFLLNGGNDELFATSFLLWLATASLLWEKRTEIPFNSGGVSMVLGGVLIGLVVVRTFSPAGYHLRLSPILSFLGLCLITSKAPKLHYYAKELVILSLLAIAPILEQILELINLPLITAKFATFSLWYTGFTVERQDLYIMLPQGRVEVYGACSGVESMTQMLNIAVLFILLFPTRWYQKIYAVFIAVIIGFVVNALRVALLALLVSNSDQEAFDYWHGGDGSLVFFVICVLIFAAITWFTMLRENPNELKE